MKYLKAVWFFVVVFWVSVLLFNIFGLLVLLVLTILPNVKSKKLWLAPDQMINVWSAWFLNKPLSVKYRFGHEDETLSSVVGKNLTQGEHFVIIDNCLSYFLRDDNHSTESIEKNEGDKFVQQKVND